MAPVVRTNTGVGCRFDDNSVRRLINVKQHRFILTTEVLIPAEVRTANSAEIIRQRVKADFDQRGEGLDIKFNVLSVNDLGPVQKAQETVN